MKLSLPLHSQNKNGALSERSGTGLQNHSRRFDSATHLKAYLKWYAFFVALSSLSYIDKESPANCTDSSRAVFC